MSSQAKHYLHWHRYGSAPNACVLLSLCLFLYLIGDRLASLIIASIADTSF